VHRLTLTSLAGVLWEAHTHTTSIKCSCLFDEFVSLICLELSSNDIENPDATISITTHLYTDREVSAPCCGCEVPGA
jgi:hypothetical protein